MHLPISGIILFLDVLHLNTPSTSSTNSSHPTQGRYPRISFLCYSGRLAIIYFFGCSPSQHTKCWQYSKYWFKPPNTRTIPTYLLLVLFRVLAIISFFGCSPSQHTKCWRYSKYRFKPPNTRMIPFLRDISFLCSLGCFTKLRHFCSHTPHSA